MFAAVDAFLLRFEGFWKASGPLQLKKDKFNTMTNAR